MGVTRQPVVLLPAGCSEWPLLLKDREWPTYPHAIIKMSDQYLNICLEHSQNRAYDLAAYKSFLRQTFGASDLPDLSPFDDPFPGLTNLSSAQSLILLQWLNRCQKDRTGYWNSLAKFWSSFKTTAWVHTDEHGLQLPRNCFMPTKELSLLDRSEVPFISESFYVDVRPYSKVLCDLGVVDEPKSGCEAVFEQVRDMITRASVRTVDQSQIEKFYHYLYMFGWEPTPSQLSDIKIYIPAGCVTTDGPASWQEPEECLLGDEDRLFNGVLPSLSDIYNPKLLSFFEKTLGVPTSVHFSRYYDLWIQWCENSIHSTVERCAELWQKIAVNWKNCDATVKQKFKAKAVILTGTMHYTIPTAAFIPDDLQRRQMFMIHTSTPVFVWYPSGSSAFEAELNDVYASLGVRRLSECVKTHVEMDPANLGNCESTKAPMFMTSGLLVAVLGFISKSKYGWSSEERQAILQPLCETVEKEIVDPFRISYSITSDSSSVTTTVERQLLGFWDQKVLYRLKDGKLLIDAALRREMQTQVLETMCSQILPDSPSIASSLVDFLKTLVGCRFDKGAVEHELQRKNLKLYSEDLKFLQVTSNSSLCPESEDFRSLLLM
ncbi:hypothetical protein Mapa_003325 [Marchantia paleacea]|nr:hypothetical protein Mapa_003325 [Marchantia paleacea]